MEIRTIQKDRKEGTSKFNLRHTLLYAEKGLPDSNIPKYSVGKKIDIQLFFF